LALREFTKTAFSFFKYGERDYSRLGEKKIAKFPKFQTLESTVKVFIKVLDKAFFNKVVAFNRISHQLTLRWL
jgi:hypothetical protein